MFDFFSGPTVPFKAEMRLPGPCPSPRDQIAPFELSVPATTLDRLI